MVETRAALATEDGVRAVYAAHGPELFRFAARSLNDRGLAEEAVQETFVRAWRASDRFDDALGSLRTWLFAIIRNVVIDLSRARAVRPALAATATAEDVIDLTDDAVDRVLGAWQVEEALRMVSEEHRRVLVEVHYRGAPTARSPPSSGSPWARSRAVCSTRSKAMRLALEELGWTDDE